ncbi:flagellar brake protein [Luteimonas sp. RD2P54]|uniref:Flagellar brake protein n=1 Tax=Luteimonas endophytica TaxID=3042023 RepID=A0ABT6JA46_9GAMM|nr:flagellar brake protein [Luteimonas endophytica]MDH5823692.1 flagellar brake protein [Luteimonas endophytica]
MEDPDSSTAPQPPGIGSGDKCLLRDPRAIRGLLQRLVAGGGSLMATVDGGISGLALPALALDGDTLWLGAPRERRPLQRLLRAGHLSLQASLAGALLRFGTAKMTVGRHAGTAALGVPLPARLLHVQRRLEPRREPSGGPLACVIHARAPSGGETALRVTIRDICGGGLALVTSETELPFACGDLLPGCEIEVAGPEPLLVAMRVRHVRRLRQRGRQVHQFGCEFIGLSEAARERLASV